MPTATLNARSLTPALNQLAERLNEVRIPNEAFDPNGSWQQTYSVLAYDSGAACGRLTLRRQPHEADATQSTLEVRWLKGAGPGATWAFDISATSRADALGSLVSWGGTGSRKIGRFDAIGEDVANTDIRRTGKVVDGRIVVRTGDGTRAATTVSAEPVVLNWQLFDVVQRSPRGPLSTNRFSVLDHFEMVKPQQRLSYRGELEVTTGSGARTLHAYDLVGPGSLPWSYWVDGTSNRLIAAASGLEAYVLGSLAPGGGKERASKKKSPAKDE